MRRTRQLLLSALIVCPLAIYIACSDDVVYQQAPNGTSSGRVDAATDRKTTPTGDDDAKGDDDTTSDDDDAPSSGIERGPISLDFDKDGNGDPTSLLWDATDSALYIADNKNNDIWKWTDATKTFTKFLKIPNTNATGQFPTDVGQLVRLADGTFVVPRFGGGTNGAIAFVKEGGDKGEIPGVDPAQKRVALGAAGGQNMFGGTFLKSSGDDAGLVTKVTLTAETLYAGGFQKPVSTLVVGTQLFVVDQGRDTIYVLPTDGTAAPPYHEYAKVAAPDTTVEGPNKTLITGQFKVLTDGGGIQLRKVATDGTVTTFDTSKLPLSKAKGLAYDKKGKRLFVADSNGSAVRTIKIFPLE